MQLKAIKKNTTTLKPKIIGKPMQKEEEEKPKKQRKSQENKLPPDGYQPMFPPVRMLVRETPSTKDPTKVVKQYVEISVKRYDDDEALPFVWLQMYQESDFYTGYLKGKSVHFPLEMLYDVLEALQRVDEECEKRKIE